MNVESIQLKFSDEFGRPFGGHELFDDVSDTVYFVKNRHGHYVFVNQTLVERCGRGSADELIGRTAGEVFPSPLGEEFQKQDSEILSGGAAIRGQLELHFYAGGRQGWCLTWKRGLRNAAGEIVGLSGISRDVGGASPSANDLASLAKVLDYIRDHLGESLRLADLSAATGLSEYQIGQRIEGLFGVSTTQYVRRCRIDAACHALKSSSEPLGDIAFACGFSDQSSFTRQFGQTVGMTPKVYRERA